MKADIEKSLSRRSVACRNKGGIRNFKGELTLRKDGTFVIGSSDGRTASEGYLRCWE